MAVKVTQQQVTRSSPAMKRILDSNFPLLLLVSGINHAIPWRVLVGPS